MFDDAASYNNSLAIQSVAEERERVNGSGGTVASSMYGCVVNKKGDDRSGS